MITLTSPPAVPNVLGGTTTVSYDKLVLISAHYDVLNKTITGDARLTSSADAAQTPLFGSYGLFPQQSPATVQLDFPTVPFHRTFNMTAAQQTAVLGWISGAQNQIEAGYVSVGVVAGTQSTGN